MIEILLKEHTPNVIKETLSRMGVFNRVERILYPSIYLHEVDGRYFLIHFKEWFMISYPTSYNNISEDDKNRVAYVASLLHKWNLIEYVDFVKPRQDRNLFCLKKSEVPTVTIKHKIKL